MIRKAVFPGSFDPITRGHEDIIRRALPLFDELIVAVGTNIEKTYLFPADLRERWIRQVFGNMPGIRIVKYEGITVQFCKNEGAGYILRGLRTSADFEFERSIGQVNKKLEPAIETIFLLTSPEFSSLNSSIVRDILRHSGDASQFVPQQVDLNTEEVKQFVRAQRR